MLVFMLDVVFVFMFVHFFWLVFMFVLFFHSCHLLQLAT
jgi:hypothetical protein